MVKKSMKVFPLLAAIATLVGPLPCVCPLMLLEVGGLFEGSWTVMALVGAVRGEFPSLTGIDLAVAGQLLHWPWGGSPKSSNK